MKTEERSEYRKELWSHLIIRIGICMDVMTNGTHMYDHFLMMTTLYTKGNTAQLLETILVCHTVKSHIVNLITKLMVFASDLITDDDNSRYNIANLSKDDRGKRQTIRRASYLSWMESNLGWESFSVHNLVKCRVHTKCNSRHARSSVDTSWNDLYSLLLPFFRETLLNR